MHNSKNLEIFEKDFNAFKKHYCSLKEKNEELQNIIEIFLEKGKFLLGSYFKENEDQEKVRSFINFYNIVKRHSVYKGYPSDYERKTLFPHKVNPHQMSSKYWDETPSEEWDRCDLCDKTIFKFQDALYGEDEDKAVVICHKNCYHTIIHDMIYSDKAIVDYISSGTRDSKAAGFSLPGWYFWDEAYSCYGPYPTYINAYRESQKYIKQLNQERHSAFKPKSLVSKDEDSDGEEANKLAAAYLDASETNYGRFMGATRKLTQVKRQLAQAREALESIANDSHRLIAEPLTRALQHLREHRRICGRSAVALVRVREQHGLRQAVHQYEITRKPG